MAPPTGFEPITRESKSRELPLLYGGIYEGFALARISAPSTLYLMASLRCEATRIPTVTPPHSPWHGRLIGYSRLRQPSRLNIFAAARNFNPLAKLSVVPSLTRMLTTSKTLTH